MQRILIRHDLQPHRVRYFLQITDPDFFPKMERLIELYTNPPKNLFCFDECPGLQILQRITPNYRPTDTEDVSMFWQEFEYIRNGTTDLFCFLNVNSGEISATCRPKHTTEIFIEEFIKHVESQPKNEDVHYIMDNLNTHCSYDFCKVVADQSGIDCPSESELDQCYKRREFLQRRNKRIVIHFTPFHGSWLNQAESCFRIIRDKCLKDSYISPDAIIEAIKAFVEKWNKDWAHPFKWEYDGKGLHKKVVQRFVSMLKNSSSEITLQYITKSSNLMLSMLKKYEGEVDSNLWRELFDIVIERHGKICEHIRECTQPKVKKKAAEAFENLLSKAKSMINAS